MAATDRQPALADAASEVAAELRDAELAHLVASADGDGLAAAGLLAAACRATGVPFHVRVVRTAAEADSRLADRDDSATAVVVGVDAAGETTLGTDGAVSPLAFEVAAALGAEPDPVTALAGVVAADAVPSQVAPDLLERAALERAALERTPGVATPTDDLADGLAHCGLVHAPFSGDVDAAGEVLRDLGLADATAETLDGADAKRLASLVALAAVDAPEATPMAATAVERALRPHRTGGPFVTLAGYADVLDALAERAPGLGVALAAGGSDAEPALEAWREHGRAAHAAVASAETARYDGVLVARTDGPLAAVARLLRDFRSPEPVVLAVGEGEAAAASLDDPVSGPLAAAAQAGRGSSSARGRRGVLTFDPDRTERVVDAFREAV